jgi:hypothetical protein
MEAAERSCGKGLAAGGDVPAALAELITAMADVLEQHTHALDAADIRARRELQAYRAVIVEQRKAASQLDATAALMRSHRDLPPAPHNEEVMRSEAAAKAFERYKAAAEAARTLLARAASMGR